MKLREVRLINFKSFDDSGWIPLSDRMNVIVGKNDVGKTAFLQGLRLLNSNPYRGLEQEYGAPLNPFSRLERKVAIPGKRLRNTLMGLGQPFYMPIEDRLKSDPLQALESMLASDYIEFGIAHTPAKASEPLYKTEIMSMSESSTQDITFVPDRAKDAFSFNNSLSARVGDTANNLYFTDTFLFNSERFSISRSSSEPQFELRPDASNLPSFLHYLHGNNPMLFRRYNEAVGSIIESIKYVAVPSVGSSQCEIQLWKVPVETERSDLVISLAESGSGVSQVLAILYVVMMTKNKLILIDEPNSFLHPSATKKLLRIIGQYDHQYIITTHSPEVITACNPDNIIRVGQEKGKSAISIIDKERIDQVRYVLDDIGSNLSDTFGIDKIVWVEGKTEEICFPMIVEHRGINLSSIGCVFLGVKNTGDFDLDKKLDKAQAACDLYRSVSNVNPLLPTEAKFLFDRELRESTKIEQAERESKEMMHFIPRRMYENYLLSPQAIKDVLQESGEKISLDVISEILKQKITEYRAHTRLGSEKEFCDAGRVLRDVFSHLTEERVMFKKAVHSVALTDKLLKADDEGLSQLCDLLERLITTSA